MSIEYDKIEEFEANAVCDYCKSKRIQTEHTYDIDEDFDWESEVQCKCLDCNHFWFEPVIE